MAFLWTLNEYLQGRLKEVASGIFTLLILVFVAIAFVISGWIVGIGALVGAFVLVIILRPVALAVARRIIRYPDLGFENYNRRRFEKTMADFGSESYFNRRETEEDEEERHKGDTISMAMNNPVIIEILTQYGATEQDLAAFYDRIEVRSLPLRVRKSALNNAELVAFLLKNSEPYDVYDGTYGRKLSEGTHIRLQLWIQGKEPSISRF